MFQIPAFMLKQMYVASSLRNTETGFRFAVCNPFVDGTVTGVLKVAMDGEIFDLGRVKAAGWPADSVTAEAPLNFPRGAELEVEVDSVPLPEGRHNLYIKVDTSEFGALKVDVFDRI